METEKAETLEVYEIDKYDPNGTGAEYLVFHYQDTKTGREYSRHSIITFDHSYKVGDPVEVVTRNGRPDSLLSQTKRKRQRTALERVADVGYDCGMNVHIIITAALLLLFGIPNLRMISEEIRKRKKFFVINTVVYALITVSVCLYLIKSLSFSFGWEDLEYAIIAFLLYLAGILELIISWIANSVILKKKEKRKV